MGSGPGARQTTWRCRVVAARYAVAGRTGICSFPVVIVLRPTLKLAAQIGIASLAEVYPAEDPSTDWCAAIPGGAAAIPALFPHEIAFFNRCATTWYWKRPYAAPGFARLALDLPRRNRAHRTVRTEAGAAFGRVRHCEKSRSLRRGLDERTGLPGRRVPRVRRAGSRRGSSAPESNAHGRTSDGFAVASLPQQPVTMDVN